MTKGRSSELDDLDRFSRRVTLDFLLKRFIEENFALSDDLGRIQNRSDLLAYVKEIGGILELEGNNFITISFEGELYKCRLTGPLYSRNYKKDPRSLLATKADINELVLQFRKWLLVSGITFFTLVIAFIEYFNL